VAIQLVSVLYILIVIYSFIFGSSGEPSVMILYNYI